MSSALTLHHDRHNPLPCLRPAQNREPIRLPSYKDLTVASNCEDAFPRSAPAQGRPNLFTAGLVQLPPLKVPNSPRTTSNGRKNQDILSPGRSSPYAVDLRFGDFSSAHANARTERDTNGYRSWPHVPLSLRDAPSSATSRPSSTYARLPLLAPSDTIDPPPSPPLPPSVSNFGHIHITPASPTFIGSAEIGQATLQPLKFNHANTKAGVRTKKQALSCYFCRERKIACGRPEGGVGACNQCTRRKQPCSYPTVSHRGQHSRIMSAARKAAVLAPGADVGQPQTRPFFPTTSRSPP